MSQGKIKRKENIKLIRAQPGPFQGENICPRSSAHSQKFLREVKGSWVYVAAPHFDNWQIPQFRQAHTHTRLRTKHGVALVVPVWLSVIGQSQWA